MEISKDDLKNLYDRIIDLAEIVYAYSVKLDALNSQEYLDWQDSLNEISVR